MESWTVDGVVSHFKELGASEEDLETLRKEQIDGLALSMMSKEDLEGIISTLGVRLRHRKLVESGTKHVQEEEFKPMPETSFNEEEEEVSDFDMEVGHGGGRGGQRRCCYKPQDTFSFVCCVIGFVSSIVVFTFAMFLCGAGACKYGEGEVIGMFTVMTVSSILTAGTCFFGLVVLCTFLFDKAKVPVSIGLIICSLLSLATGIWALVFFQPYVFHPVVFYFMFCCILSVVASICSTMAAIRILVLACRKRTVGLLTETNAWLNVFQKPPRLVAFVFMCIMTVQCLTVAPIAASFSALHLGTDFMVMIFYAANYMAIIGGFIGTIVGVFGIFHQIVRVWWSKVWLRNTLVTSLFVLSAVFIASSICHIVTIIALVESYGYPPPDIRGAIFGHFGAAAVSEFLLCIITFITASTTVGCCRCCCCACCRPEDF